MKVLELRELLANYDPDAQVHFEYDYGDHWHTVVAPNVSSVHADGLAVHYSEYHRMPELIDENNNDYCKDDFCNRKGYDGNIVVLSTRGL